MAIQGFGKCVLYCIAKLKTPLTKYLVNVGATQTQTSVVRGNTVLEGSVSMVKRGVFSGLSLWYPGISGEGPRFSQALGTCPRTVWQSGDGCCPPVIQGLRD